MYTIIVTFEDLTEVYQATDYNDDIKQAIENITLYGEDCVEFVFEGCPVFNQHGISSLKKITQRFKDEGLFQMYFAEDEKAEIDRRLDILEKVAV
jgi:hypothetical protein